MSKSFQKLAAHWKTSTVEFRTPKRVGNLLFLSGHSGPRSRWQARKFPGVDARFGRPVLSVTTSKPMSAALLKNVRPRGLGRPLGHKLARYRHVNRVPERTWKKDFPDLTPTKT